MHIVNSPEPIPDPTELLAQGGEGSSSVEGARNFEMATS